MMEYDREQTAEIITGQNFEYEYIEKVDEDGFDVITRWLINSPFMVVAGVSIPAVATIGLYNSQRKFMTVSQRVLQTRVMGQAVVLSVLMGTMGFNAYHSHVEKTARKINL